MTNFSKRTNGQTFQKKSKCSLEKNERTNILKNIKMHFGDKTNGQTFRKKAKFSFEKSSFEFKKRKDKHLKKKQMQFGEQRTDKHFQNSKIHFGEKTNGQTFQKKSKTLF